MDSVFYVIIGGLSIIAYSLIILFITTLQKQIDELKKKREEDLANRLENLKEIEKYINTINSNYSRLNSYVKEFYIKK